MYLIMEHDKKVIKIAESCTRHGNIVDIDGQLYFSNGINIEEIEFCSQEVRDNPSFFKYENGEFRKRIDLQTQIENELIMTLISEGTI